MNIGCSQNSNSIVNLPLLVFSCKGYVSSLLLVVISSGNWDGWNIRKLWKWWKICLHSSLCGIYSWCCICLWSWQAFTYSGNSLNFWLDNIIMEYSWLLDSMTSVKWKCMPYFLFIFVAFWWFNSRCFSRA